MAKLKSERTRFEKSETPYLGRRSHIRCPVRDFVQQLDANMQIWQCQAGLVGNLLIGLGKEKEGIKCSIHVTIVVT